MRFASDQTSVFTKQIGSQSEHTAEVKAISFEIPKLLSSVNLLLLLARSLDRRARKARIWIVIVEFCQKAQHLFYLTSLTEVPHYFTCVSTIV